MKPSQIYNKSLKESKLNTIKKTGDAVFFDDRFDGIVNFLNYVIMPIVVLWCAITGGAFVAMNIYQLTQSTIAAGLIAALFVVFLEASQLKVGKKIIDAVAFGWFREGWHIAAFVFVLLVFWALAFGGSIYLSVKGSPITSSYIADIVCPPTLSNTDSISGTYKAALLSQDSKTNTALGIRTEKGIVSWKGQKIAELSEKNKGKMLDLQLSELSSVIARDSLGYAKFETFKKSWGTWISAFGGWAEGIKLLILILTGIFTFATYKERFGQADNTDDDGKDQPTRNKGFQNLQHDYKEVTGQNGLFDTPDNHRTVVNGFFPGIQTSHTTQNHVSTNAGFVDTNLLEQQINQISDKHRKAYITVLMRDLKAYEGKLRSNTGKKSTNENHIQRLQNEIQAELSSVGESA